MYFHSIVLSEIPRILADKGVKISSERSEYEIFAFIRQNSGKISVQA
jgi:hypothetical protein